MTVIAMSRTEIDRMSVLQDLATSRITVAEAATLMRLTRRQVFRLAKAYPAAGPERLVSRRRGRPSNRRLSGGCASEVIGIIRERYADFGPTLARREAGGAARHSPCPRDAPAMDDGGRAMEGSPAAAAGLCISRAIGGTVLGELIQIDGSEHWWFEDRGPQCTLLVYIDDATSRLMHLQFVASESRPSTILQATRAYLERHGKPVAFYSDKHGVFRVNKEGCGRAATA